MSWLNSKQRRLLILGLLAIAWWYSSLLLGRVAAVSSLPTVEIQLGEIAVADLQQPEQWQKKEFILESQIPGCEVTTITLEWLPLKNLGTPNFESNTLVWEENEQSVDFQLSSDCPEKFWIKVTRPVLSQTDLPWGAAKSSGTLTTATGENHFVEIFPGEFTNLKWYLGSRDVPFHFDINAGHTITFSPIALTPLISTWWKGSQLQGDCHETADLFWQQEFHKCMQSSDVAYFEHPGEQTVVSSFNSPLPGDIIISEVNWAGAFSHSNNLATDEWIELMNLSPEPLNVGKAYLEGVTSTAAALTLPESLIIPPFGFVVISRLEENSRLSYRGNFSSPSLSLSNSTSDIVLRLPDGTELDRTPGGPWKAGKNSLSPPFRASAQRKLLSPFPGGDWKNWETCSEDSDTLCALLSLNTLFPHSHLFATPWQPSPW